MSAIREKSECAIESPGMGVEGTATVTILSDNRDYQREMEKKTRHHEALPACRDYLPLSLSVLFA